MTLLGVPARDLTEVVLRSLIEAQVPEGKFIDYKAELPGNADAAKKDFLADLCSFANVSGGHLIVGMTEEGGLPKELIGIEGDIDQAILRLESMARDGIRPSIPGLEFARVPLSGGKAAIVIEIPKSWNPPHQVIFQKDYRFYTRGSAGKQHFDVDELRRVVNFSQDIGERVRQFRANRLGTIMNGEIPGRLSPGARQILHFIPLGTFATGGILDLSAVSKTPQLLVDVTCRAGSTRYNVDGFLAHSQSAQPMSYAQLFRNGVLEVAHVLSGGQSGTAIPSLTFEEEIFEITEHAFKVLKASQAVMPVVMLLSFVGVKGWRMAIHDPFGFHGDTAGFDRNPILVPETIIEGPEIGNIKTLVKPILDSAWQAADFNKSIYYDDNGMWVGRP